MTDLLSPISPSSPCGEDLSFSSEFDLIQELRREDDPTLDQGEWITALKTADWPAVVSQCDALLQQRTKDLRLLVWRVEALAQVQGYAGLARGLEDCLGVCSAFWTELHPLPEDGDAEQRAGAIRWLLGQVQRLARMLPVTRSPAGRFSLLEFDEGRQRQLAQEREAEGAAAASAEGKVALAQMQKARRDTPPEFWRENVNALSAARAHLQSLQALVDPALGEQAPSFVHARQALEDAYHAVERLAREAGALHAAAPAPAAEAAHAHDVAEAPVTAQSFAAAEPRTRAQALQQLRLVAEFFRRTEPHSPVAFLADKAARWGEMPLQSWLREVIKDAGSLAHLEELLGVQPPPSSEG
jgi:type VI secretion system protein ImpA